MAEKDDIFDVAIIGSGPAGGFAAMQCAKLGLSTAVFEEHKLAGEPVHCGECLSDLCISKFLPDLPESVISSRIKGIRVIFPNKKETVLNESGVVLEKHLFEQHLAQKAQEQGAKYFFSSRINSMKYENSSGKWSLGTGQNTYFSKLIIDASGVAQVSSRLLGLNAQSSAVLGAQFEMQDIPQDGYLDFYLHPSFAPEGYLWMIPKSGSRANVGLVTTEKQKIKFYLDQFVREMGWQDKPINKSFGGLIPSSGPLANTYSDGLMLIGDAAGFTSPMFEGGTHLGVSSAAMASLVAKKALDCGNTSKQTLIEYENKWTAEFPNYSKLIKGKKAFYSFNDREISQIGSSLPDDLTHLSVIDKGVIGAKLLLTNPSLLAKNATGALMTFAYSKADHYGW